MDVVDRLLINKLDLDLRLFSQPVHMYHSYGVQLYLALFLKLTEVKKYCLPALQLYEIMSCELMFGYSVDPIR